MSRLQPLINPTSIAVVGASRRSGAVGNEVLLNLLKGGFRGELYAVNPGCDEVEGVRCYPDLGSLPAVPEHVIFAVADHRLENLFEQIIAAGVKAATVFSSLQLPQDTQPPLIERLRRRALAAGLLLAGANGMGFFNFRERVWACGFDTRAHRQPGNVVLLSQSGAGMSGILDCDERIDFLFAASTGQELVVSVEDYLDYVLDLPETRVVGLFLETSRKPLQLVQALQKACDRNIPIVALKVGRTDKAAELAVSHSGALAGSDASFQAVFDRYGVQRVDDMDELATALIMFAQPRKTASGGLATLHDSGGERQLLIDMADQQGVALAPLTDKSREHLGRLLDPGLPAVNPLDGWGAGGEGAHDTMAALFATLLADETVALAAVVHDRAPQGQIYTEYLRYMERALAAVDKPVFLVSSRQGTGEDAQVLEATRRGMPVLDGVSTFLAGARALMARRDYRPPAADKLPQLDSLLVEEWRGRLVRKEITDECSAAEFLTAFGVSMQAYRRADSLEQALEQATSTGYPVVLKTASPDIVHKSDCAGVVLDIADARELEAAYQELATRLSPAVVISPMFTEPAVEMILGITRDDHFGPMIVLGMGGIHAELLHDRVVLMPPFDADTVRRSLQRLALFPLLQGVRGSAAVDVAALCNMAARLSVLAVEYADELAEMDINPVAVSAAGCRGLDALVRLADREQARIRPTLQLASATGAQTKPQETV